MPIYEFECPVHGRFEELVPLRLFESSKNGILCGKLVAVINNGMQPIFCTRTAIKVWSLPGNVQIGKPTRMFINNKTGEVFTPFKSYDKPPKGYHEIELRNPSERSKFEKEQQHKLDAQNEFTSYCLDQMKQESRNNRHDNLKARMNSIQRETFTNKEGKEETIEFTLNERDKALVNKSMERSRNKKIKEKKSDVMLVVNHFDNSNLDQVK